MEKITCSKCGIDLPYRYKFYSDEARHAIHRNDDTFVSRDL